MNKYIIGETFDLQEYMKDLNIEYFKRQSITKTMKERKTDGTDNTNYYCINLFNHSELSIIL